MCAKTRMCAKMRKHSGTPALRHSGTPALRHSGTPALRHSGTPALRHSGTPALRHSGTPALRHSGTPALRHSGTPALRHSGTPALRHSGTPALRHSGTPALRHSGTPALRHSGTPALRHSELSSSRAQTPLGAHPSRSSPLRTPSSSRASAARSRLNALRRIAGLALLCLFASGLATPAQAQEALIGPALSNLSANPASIKLGESSALRWTPRQDVANVVVTLPDGTTADVDPQKSRYEVTPDAVGTFAYTLAPEDEEGSPLPIFELTVTVRPTWTDDPVLSNLSANPASIKLGESSALRWTPRQDVANVVVTLPDGTTADVDPQKSRYEVTPDAVGTFTYTLAPEDEEGSPLPIFELTVTVRPTWTDDPVLSNVIANPPSITLGESSTLSWTPRQDVANVVVTLPDGTTADVDPQEGRYVVTPLGTFTYTLAPEDEEGSPLPIFELTVTVRPTWTDDPVLSNVIANPPSITLGESSTLSWTPRQDVANVVVTLPDGTTVDVDPQKGRYEVTPDALGTFTYTLAPEDEDEEGSPLPTFELTVTVRPTWTDDPVLSNVIANPPSITLGESSTLSWTPRQDVANVVVTLPDGTTVDVDPQKGRYEVTPDALGTFTYTLAPEDEDEEGSPLPTFELTVTVRPTWTDDPVLSNVIANPPSITLGESSTLSWTPRQDVANVVVTLPDGTTVDVDPQKGRYEVTPDALGTFTYTLAPEDEDEEGSPLPTFELTVTVRPTWTDDPVLSNLSANPPSIKLGESSALEWTPREDVVKVVVTLPDGTTADVDPQKSRYEVTPDALGTFTYTLAPEDEDEEGSPLPTFELTVTVRPTWTDDPVLSNVIANPPSITLGESSTLSWTPREDVANVVVTLPDGTANVDPMEGHYAVQPNAVGTFTYTLSAEDAEGALLGDFKVTVTVKPKRVPPPPRNRAPVAYDDGLDPLIEVVRGGSVVVQSSALLANDTDADGDTLTVDKVVSASGGTAVLAADGDTVTFTHDGKAEKPTFVYRADDGRGGTDTATVTITITITVTEPVNQPPTAVTVAWVAAATGGRIAEDVDAGAGRVKIADLSATDPDDDTHAFAVSDTATFEMDGAALYIRQGVALDHETTPSYAFTVTATDAGGLSATSAEQTLTVKDANEAPTAVTVAWVAAATGGRIAENTDTRGGPVRVAVLSATDPDAGDNLMFSLGGADADAFELNGKELSIRRGVRLDQDTRPAYAITVTATDAAGLSVTTEAVLQVDAENEATARSRLERVNEAILPELTRALTAGAVEAVERRVAAASGSGAASAAAPAQNLEQLLWSQAPALRDGRWQQALGNSSFAMPLSGGSGSGGSSGMTLWGGGDYRSLSGDGDAAEWDGDVLSARIGLDARVRENLLAGLAVSWSKGDFDYTDRGPAWYLPIDGTHESEMLGLHPYVGWTPRENLSLWGALGYGTGEVTLKDDAAGKRSSDAEQTTAAFGGRSRLFSDGGVIEGGTTALNLKGELWTSRFKLADDGLIDGVQADAWRLRLGLEGAHEHRLSGGGKLTPSVELGVRHDGGDGEAGAGLELGGGLAWINPVRGLRIEGFGRALLAHEGDIDEWGAGGLITFMPDPGGRGLSFHLRPTWGMAAGSLDRLWDDRAGGPGGPYDARRASVRLETQVGYGLGVGGGLLTPFGGMALDDGGAKRYRLGGLFKVGRSFTMSLELEHRESAWHAPDNGFMLRLRYVPDAVARQSG